MTTNVDGALPYSTRFNCSTWVFHGATGIPIFTAPVALNPFKALHIAVASLAQNLMSGILPPEEMATWKAEHQSPNSALMQRTTSLTEIWPLPPLQSRQMEGGGRICPIVHIAPFTAEGIYEPGVKECRSTDFLGREKDRACFPISQAGALVRS
jgi:hypothetical protein